ncbi:MAG: LutB/LldF family L-lactate oxidation iron-sulfur protein [Chloroflexota bacterium]
MAGSTVTFKKRVAESVHDEALHKALRRATDRFGANRIAMLATLPDAEEARDRARAIRRHTVANLARYLGQFVESVERVGGKAHWAADADEANRIIADLARARGVNLVVKGKSMVSEETELNQALEVAGVTAQETDLAEFVLQLQGSVPSHIVVPIVHMTRQDVSRLFHEKLGSEETEDVLRLARIARETLRRKYVEAGMGFTGANFGVAETGTIVTVTNEGNGRLSSSLPRCHVVLMGIERLVPTLEDLGLMLQLLARSATGQKLSVYSNMVTGPRRGGDDDGPEELHIVLIDNGRTRILESEYAEMLTCIRCGACLNACPVYKLIGGHAYGAVYPGPMGSVLSPLFEGLDRYHDLPHASSLCGACREVCPVRIDLPGLLLRLRRDTVREGHRPWWLKLGISGFATAAGSPALFRIGSNLAGFGSRLISKQGWITGLPAPLNAWTDTRDFPSFVGKSFQARWKERQSGRNR